MTYRPGRGETAPDYPRSICSVLPTAYHLLGIKLPRYYSKLDLPWRPSRRFDQLFFFFLDSLGLEACRRGGGLFSKLLKTHGVSLTSVFPSITSTALCSIYTGRTPARHGILGHKIYLDEIRTVVDVLRTEIPGQHKSITSVGLPVRHWLQVPPLFSTEFTSRRQIIHISPHSILNSGISDMIYPSHLRREGYEEFIEGVGKVEYFLKRGSDIINFYHHGVDESTHKFGGLSSQALFSLRTMESGVSFLARALPKPVRRRTLFVLVSDHGQNTFTSGRLLHFKYEEIRGPARSRGLLAIGTSGRLGHVYSAVYPNPALEKWLETKCRGKAKVVPRHASWILSGGAGPRPAYARRLGDYTLILEPGVKLRVEFSPPREETQLRFSCANHGSLSLEEMLVPALFAPMDEIPAE